MRILFDHQAFFLQKYGGISRYFCELYSHLSSINTIHPEMSVLYTKNTHFQELFHRRIDTVIPKKFERFLFFTDSRVINKINENYCSLKIKTGNYDIFHPTYYNPYFLKNYDQQPYVLTVYDMIHEHFPEMFIGDITEIHKKKVIKNATKIIAISNNTKNDLIKYYNIEPKKIEVIHLATSLHTIIPDKTLQLPKKYLLFVGDRERYKNFTFFIKSISTILKRENDLFLICAGGGFFSEIEIRLLNDLNIKTKVIYYSIPNDSTLSLLYRNAICFIFPSLYEGFGIPLLEAFSCGCPVAASNCSSFPEIGEKAVNYFDPNSSKSIQTVVEDIIYNNSLQDSLRLRGFQRLKNFSWEKTALRTKEVYESIIDAVEQ